MTAHTSGIGRPAPSLLTWPREHSNLDDVRNYTARRIFKLAAMLTTPICQMHKSYFMPLIIPYLYPKSPFNTVRKTIEYTKALLLLIGGSLPTLMGIGLRGLACSIQEHPWTYVRGTSQGKMTLSNDEQGRKYLKLLTWNICGLETGHAIGSGGVMPWKEIVSDGKNRIDKVITALKEEQWDVICLQETLSTDVAEYIITQFEGEFAECYFNIAPGACKVNSGLMVISRFRIENPEFRKFRSDELAPGISHQGSNKGCFAFDVCTTTGKIATIFTSHFGHSRIPDKAANTTPEQIRLREEEENGRGRQLKATLEMMSQDRSTCPKILTGDLNDNEEGLSESLQRILEGDKNKKSLIDYWNRLKKGTGRSDGEFSWGGEGLFSPVASGPVNLDHTWVLNATIKTILNNTGYKPDQFNIEATSDHRGLFSHVYI